MSHVVRLVVAAWFGLVLGLGTSASAQAAAVPSRSCEAIHSLATLSADQRAVLLRACAEGPSPGGALYSALFRLVSSPGWHAAVVDAILRRSGSSSLTAFAPDVASRTLSTDRVQSALDRNRDAFSAGSACTEFQQLPVYREFVEAIVADEPPPSVPFTSRFAACMGADDSWLDGTRLMTIRADGLLGATVVVGTREYVHARSLSRDDALSVGNHLMWVVAVPDASPAVVIGHHEHQRLPVVWRGLVNRNTLVWPAPPRRSCLDVSAKLDAQTRLYIDGTQVAGPAGALCTAAASTPTEPVSVDRTLTITLDRAGSGLVDHEVAALTCEDGAPVVRHLSAVPAIASEGELRVASDCGSLSLDLSAPAEERVAVLGVTKMPGCESTPLWATDVAERVRNILERDPAHNPEPGSDDRDRIYANFSAYAEATEALGALESRLGRPPRDDESRDDNANMLLGSAAQEAWRQGIDTLLSFAVQCTERGTDDQGRPQWAYSIRATSIGVSGLFARGYYGRDGLDLKEFIGVHSVAFDDARLQDAAVGTLLDRVFSEPTARLANPTEPTSYRYPPVIRLSRYFEGEGGPAETLKVVQTRIVGRRYCDATTEDDPACRGPARVLRPGDPRPRVCEGLVHRGARSAQAIEQAGRVYAALVDEPAADKPGNGARVVTLQRSRGEYDVGDDPHAAAYEGPLELRGPGWYLVVVRDEQGEVTDASCVQATVDRRDVWGDISMSGRPVALAPNGSRLQFLLRPRFGVTWYGRPAWFGGGASIGYSFVGYQGARGDWRDLEVSVQQRQRWLRHSIVVGPHGEVRSRFPRSPVQLWSRLHVALDVGIVDVGRVDEALVQFRGGSSEDVVLDLDVGLGVQAGIGVPLGPVELRGFVFGDFRAIDDALSRSATSVTQDGNLVLGFGFGVGGGSR